MEPFSISPSINVSEEGKWLLAVTSFEATHSVFNITDEKNSFSINVSGCLRIPTFLEDGIFDKLNNLPKLRPQNDIELHVREVRKRRDKIKKNPKNFPYQILILRKKKYLKNYKSLVIMILKI